MTPRTTLRDDLPEPSEDEWLEGEWDCTHCCGEGTCDDNSDPLGNCGDDLHPCHACGGSGLRKDQRVF